MADPTPTPEQGTPTPEQLAAAADQLRAQAAATPAPPLPSEAEMAAGLAAKQSAAPSGVTDVDAAQLLAIIQQLQARVDSLEDDKAKGTPAPVVGTAETIRDLLKVHAAHNPQTDHAPVLALADDAVDAAGNALESGDGGELRKIGDRLVRAIRKIHPGPGDHHYLNQALGFAEDHLPDAIDSLQPKRERTPAAALGSDRAPARVISGSVTG